MTNNIDPFDAPGYADGSRVVRRPLLLTRNDGHALFYPGEVNYLYGEAESGKTWVALAAIAEAAKARMRCAYVDLDHNGGASLLDRLDDLVVPREYWADLDRLTIWEPDDSPAIVAMVTRLLEWKPAVVIIDSIGELMPMMGRNSNSADEFTSALRAVLTPLANVGGAAVIAVDHVSKRAEPGDGPTGTMAKRRAVSGSSIRVEVVEQPVRGRGGKLDLVVNKDRPGGLREHCPPGRDPSAGVFTLTPAPDGQRLIWNLAAPVILAAPPRTDVEALALLDPPPQSHRDVCKRMRWGAERTRAALRAWAQYHPE
jgi:hypothetical protein